MQNKFLAFLVVGNYPCRAVHIFIFQQTGMRGTIRVYQTIHTEIAIMDLLPMIPAVIINGLSILCFSMCNGVIAPLPDKAAAHPVKFLDYLEVILKIPGSVSHAVAILYQQERFTGIFLQVFPNLIQGRIHAAIQVNVPIFIGFPTFPVSGTLILCQAARIKYFCPCKCLFKVTAIRTFISHRPHHDRRAVLIPLHHQLHAIYNGSFPHRIIRDLFIPAVKPVLVGIHFPIQHDRSMCFNVCFINDHESVFVTHLVKERCVRIMTGTDCIEIVLFHQHQILSNLLHTDGKSRDWIGIMTVYPAELNLLSVKVNTFIPDFNLTKTDMIHNGLCFGPDDQCIQIRIFRIPEHRVADLKVKCSILTDLPLCDTGTFPVFDHNLCIYRRVKIKSNRYICMVCSKFGRYMVIPYHMLRPFQKIHIPKNTAHPEFILIFKIRTVTPFQHQNCQGIFPFFQEIRHIKFRCHVGYLTVT